ncbi:5-aminolevulinate synthase [Nannizzia gypsea CBS 118893]|uniref:5-aminolevulinate synthase n=1 Tax=Arthroderma gypseum (strain ATCC MYA-4604 / CBS 118893) TaxID=535722 RepID=E4UXV5_ARTGP|nr:5-aminolevulinate synthase [Nannizzia gypsea CBS 118893]EFR02787.1 5-aminolevulinate synthase [Nannizzia gypsea CBS 118893]
MTLQAFHKRFARRAQALSTGQRCCYGVVARAILPDPDLPAEPRTFAYEDFYQSIIEKKKEDKSYRYFRSISRLHNEFPFAQCATTGKKVNVWCSNDYLAMGSNSAVLAAMQNALNTYGANAGGSRNIAGHSPLMEALEASLAELHKKPAALYFSSGFTANETALSTLGSQIPGCVIFSDELNHASMIEGIRHSKAKRHIWKHNNLSSLESLLAQYPREVPKIIVFESVYSMCGTIAPIAEICDLAERYGAMTFMDEAHAIGLYGPRGAGVGEHLDFVAHQSNLCDGRTTVDRINVISGGTSKGLGTMGGYIAGSKYLIDMVRSVSRAFIFSTSQSPAVVAGAHAAIQYQLHNIEGRIALQRNVAAVKQKMAQFDLPVLPNRSHLVPVMVGDAELTRRVADILFEEYDIYVQPINSPSVAVGMERLRVNPTASHSPAQQDAFVRALVEIWERLNLRKASDWQRAGAWRENASVVKQLWTDEQLSLAVGAAHKPHIPPLVSVQLPDTLLF